MKTAIFFVVIIVALLIGYKANTFYRKIDPNVQFMENKMKDKETRDKLEEQQAVGEELSSTIKSMAAKLARRKLMPSMLILPPVQKDFTRHHVDLEEATNSHWYSPETAKH